MWVQLKTVKQIETCGKIRTYQPGDWVDVGKQAARQWLAAGDASIPEGMLPELLPADAGLVIRRAQEDNTPPDLTGLVLALQIHYDPDGMNWLPHSYNAIWRPDLHWRTSLIPVGLHLLQRWQVAAPVASFDYLASDMGSEQDRERTRAIIHDLRIPVYDTRLIFARRCPAVRKLMAVWHEERKAGDEGLAFLRALYQVNPTILALPTIWVQQP